MMSSHELFQKFGKNWVRIRKQVVETRHFKGTLEKDSLRFVDKKGEERTLIRFEEGLSHALQKQAEQPICVISFQNDQKQNVFRILYEEENSYFAIAFVDKGNGVIQHRTGKLNHKMVFDSYRISNNAFSNSLIQAFKELLKEHSTFRLFSVTGELCFQENVRKG